MIQKLSKYNNNNNKNSTTKLHQPTNKQFDKCEDEEKNNTETNQHIHTRIYKHIHNSLIEKREYIRTS